ncbi:MAG: type 4a pilus biogenesis protein PilO [Tatlockia sp.]|jgi:type IV pilus assembly protein PilO
MRKITLSELDLANWSAWPDYTQCGLVLIVALCLFLIDYFAQLRPKYSEYHALKKEETRLEKACEIKRKKANWKASEAHLQVLKKRYEEKSKVLNAFPSLSELMEQAKSGEAGAVYFEFSAHKPELEQGFYREKIIDMVVSGDYVQLTSFLNNLSLINPFITFNPIEVSKKAAGKAALEMALSLHFYKRGDNGI